MLSNFIYGREKSRPPTRNRHTTAARIAAQWLPRSIKGTSLLCPTSGHFISQTWNISSATRRARCNSLRARSLAARSRPSVHELGTVGLPSGWKNTLRRRNSARPETSWRFHVAIIVRSRGGTSANVQEHGRVNEAYSGGGLGRARIARTRGAIIRSSPRHCPFPAITSANLNRDQTLYNSFEIHLAWSSQATAAATFGWSQAKHDWHEYVWKLFSFGTTEERPCIIL